MRVLKDFGIALSLANLCFFSLWAELLPGAYGHYFLKSPPSFAMNAGVMLSVMLLAAVFWISVVLSRSSGQGFLLGLCRWVFLLALLPVFNDILRHFSAFLPDPSALGLIPKLGLALLFLLVLVRWHQRLTRAAALGVLILLPFVGVTFFQASWSLIKIRFGIPFTEFSDKAPAPMLPSKGPSSPRVVWLLFDGLDQHLTFEERPLTLELPHLDRFRAESIYASNAFPAAKDTLLSIPSLITGRALAEARPMRANELSVHLSDAERPVGWSTLPNVFSKARAMGFNTAVAGYYHPYGRVIGGDLSRCFWETDWWGPFGMDDPEATVPQVMRFAIPKMLDRLCDSFPLIWRFQPLQSALEELHLQWPSERRSEEHLRHYLSILEEAKRVATDPALGLILLHFPVPHHPFIYDRLNGNFTTHDKSSYLDNLALVDRILGEIRRVMEEAQVWENTTVVVTSDHWLRVRGGSYPLVPFMVRLPGHAQPMVYESAFYNSLIHDLSLAFLKGELSDSRRVVSWLNRYRQEVLRGSHGEGTRGRWMRLPGTSSDVS